MRKTIYKKSIGRAACFYLLVVAGTMIVINACNKSNNAQEAGAAQQCGAGGHQAATPFQQGATQSKTVSVLSLEPAQEGSSAFVIFRELEEQFTITDPSVVTSLQAALNENKAVKITFDPWAAVVKSVSAASEQERKAYSAREITKSTGSSIMVDLATANTENINNTRALGVINTSAPSAGLTDVMPDMATAQLIFDYLAHQCCEVPGPYGVDYCITYQYCEDGCYARAHKMCYVINNRYHYATHKIFSFAYPLAGYRLSVKAEKWGGCCINWWYHVAPLVNIKTPSGTKAYVFDPAMFDQPVLLATWLHAQENPACAVPGHLPKVTSFNIQPTSSYAPNDTANFITDPLYVDTDNTLTTYHSLTSCP